MRKRLAIIAALIAVACTACQASSPQSLPSNSVSLPASSADTATATASSSATSEHITAQTLHDQLADLLDRNEDLAWNYFIFDTKSGIYDPSTSPLSTDGGLWYPVTGDKFTTFAAFHDYVAATYVPSITDKLFGPWQMDQALYKDVDGVFCANANLGSGAVTNVSWDNYSFTFEQTSDITLSLDITVTIYTGDEGVDYPDGYPSEPLHLDGTATLVNGHWLLDHMIVDGTFGI